jgi:DNA-binding LytR/AlgR family response regulator
MKIKCIVIDDEPLALKKIKEYVEQVDYLELLKEFNNAIEAIGFLKQTKVDLIFLDIRMKKLSGIQFLESIKSRPKVIITSAYDEFAIKGYELDVADYLLKPFAFDRFLKSVDKVYHQLKGSKTNIKRDYIFIKTEYRIEKIILKDILYIQGMKDYLQIHTTDRKIMTLQTFKNMLEILSPIDFQRVHNSYIVAIAKIESIEKNRIRIGKALVPISDSYKENFFKVLKERNIMI